MDTQRRLLLHRALGLAGASMSAVAGLGGYAASRAQESTIKITAQRFRYRPNEISLHKGQTTVLEITSLDFAHGFNIPDLAMRADLVPGKVVTVRVRFDAPGSYDFHCDNFCGEGHEQMAGHFVVTA
ncbi:cytochrome c oxidase subunit 2 [Polaromonas sp. OV174]|uniref:cupredoxin domain-containing protein n=1 Tax=Polaromonas sp. OV174 TaxID=1855300 RepID=UPI0008E50341|nr:cupredoxin domain-containing protein [Polaromonas sp. OV174]SFB75844.1 cytochrome c oxidase subunit 2 [Polaromonas sp. OV174]